MSARPYRLTFRWHDGRKGSQSFATRKAAEERKREIESIATGLRDGSWLIATSNGVPIPAKDGEVLEFDRGCWVKRVPEAAVSCRITKRA